jgi:hypothetical protein
MFGNTACNCFCNAQHAQYDIASQVWLPDAVRLCVAQVPAGGSAEYTLVYRPLTMTPGEGQPHEGSVFFPIPDGSGLLYKLYGQVSTLAACWFTLTLQTLAG